MLTRRLIGALLVIAAVWLPREFGPREMAALACVWFGSMLYGDE